MESQGRREGGAVDQSRIQRLDLTKKTLDELAQEIEHGQYPMVILEDFKDSVDHLRTVIWTMMKLEGERAIGQGDSTFDLARKIVELRLRRTQKLLQQIQMDIDVSEIEIHTLGIVEFQRTVESVRGRLNRLERSGG